MSKEKKNKDEQPVADLPKGFPPELIPLYDWWKKDGRSWLVALLVAGAAVGAFYGFKAWRHSSQLAASTAVATANTVEELEVADAEHGSSDAGGLIKLRRAKAYYDEGRFQDAYDLYSQLAESSPEGFEDTGKLGRAHALEGLKKFEEAGAEFAKYAADEANAKSYLLLTAKLGAARCKAQAGDKDGAVKDLEALKAGYDKDSPEAMRIDDLIDVCKRWEPRSLFDVANEAAKQLQPDSPVAVPAEEKPVEPPAAEPEPAPAAPAPAVEKPAEPAPAPATPAPASAPAVEKPAEPAPAAPAPAPAA